LGFIAAASLFLAGGCDRLASAKDAVLDAVSERVPAPIVHELDQTTWRAISARSRLVEDAAAKAELAALAEPLTRAAQSRGVEANWNFHIVLAAEPNAFALPGGTIAVHTGLIALSRTGEEFVGVLGHEVGHVVARHGVKGLVTRAGASVGLSLFLGDVGGLAALALEQAVGLGLLKFSRDQEREADDLGLSLLRDARYPSEGMPRFFAGLQRLEEGRTGELPDALRGSLALLSTHPMSEERAARMKASIGADKVTNMPAGAGERYARMRQRVLANLSKEDREKHDAVAKSFARIPVKNPSR
jgi:predicted Zn-dependent protease